MKLLPKWTFIHIQKLASYTHTPNLLCERSFFFTNGKNGKKNGGYITKEAAPGVEAASLFQHSICLLLLQYKVEHLAVATRTKVQHERPNGLSL
jgi:hypothetical protein